MRNIPRLVVLCVCSLLVQPSLSKQLQLAPLPVKDIVSLPYFAPAPLSLSPSARWVAYTLIDPKRTRPIFRPGETPIQFIGSDIWISNLETGETRNLTAGRGSSWAPVWSPDGRYLAFYSDRDGLARLWICEFGSGRLRQLSSEIVVAYRGLASPPQWTPDGKHVLVPVLSEGLRPEDIAIDPRHKPRIEQNSSIKNGELVEKPTVTVFSSAASREKRPLPGLLSSYINRYSADLALVELTKGEVQRITRRQKISHYWLSPDGTHVAFANVRDDEGQGLTYDIAVVSLKSSQRQIVASNVRQDFAGRAVSWAPHGHVLSFMHHSASPGTSGSYYGECYLFSLGAKKPRKLIERAHPSFNTFRPPLWDATGQYLYFYMPNAVSRVSVADGNISEVAKLQDRRISSIVTNNGRDVVWAPDKDNSIVVETISDADMQVGFAKLELSGGKTTQLIEENKLYGYGQLGPNITGSTDGQIIIYVAQDAGHRTNVWKADPYFRNPKRVSNISPHLDKYQMGSSRLIEWKTKDGQNLNGVLLLPPNVKENQRYPLVTWIYPGSRFSRKLNEFGVGDGGVMAYAENFQLLVTRGYAVLLADTEIGPGGTIVQDLTKCVVPGVDRVIEMGIADPQRVAVMGYSQGGYATVALITQTLRFKAAVAWSGAGGNLFSRYGYLDPDGGAMEQKMIEEYAHKLGGTPWEFRERYIENSPVFYLDRVQTPLLLIHGSRDTAALPIGAEEFFADLRRLGKEVEYAKYEGEQHAFFLYANKVDSCERMIAWFDRWLNPNPIQLKALK